MPLFIAQFCAAFNNNAFKNALLIWMTYDAIENSAQHASIMVTVAAALFVLPFFLFSATAGQLADKYPKSSLIQKIRLFDIALMLACTLGFILQSTVFLLLVLFLSGTQATFFGPLKYSLLPENLHDDELIPGNALIEGGTFLAILLGTIIGGVIIDVPQGKIYLSILLLFFSVLSWLMTFLIPKKMAADKSLLIRWNIIAATWQMMLCAKKIKRIWLAITAISWFWALGAVFLTQFPTYTKQIIHGNAHIVTWFLALFSIGIAIGSILCNKLLKGKISLHLAPWGCLGMSLFIIDFYTASQLYQPSSMNEISLTLFLQQWQGIHITLALLLLAICSGLYIVPLYAVIQHDSEHQHVSRMIAVNNIMNALYMVLGSIATLALFSLGLNVKTVFLIVGIVNMTFILLLRNGIASNH
jgi:acyl-[acyl-carrier-protein]-phospholipid O-acyltransferase/long-chain-fatty-acid--[acyl-carrier-protein] ligase